MFRASSLTIISFLLYIQQWFHAGFDDHFQAESEWILTLLEAVIKNLHETYQCRTCSRKLLMMGREDVRNMYSFMTK
jgi:hypothetical protein